MFKPIRVTLPALFICIILSSCAGVNAPGIYAPKSGQGRAVLMLSGRTGTGFYEEFAQRLADSGYYVRLYDGNAFPLAYPDACKTKIREIAKDAVWSAQALPGKAVVIGYSLGGAVALACAAGEDNVIAGVIAYYPATTFIADRNACVDNFHVPLTVLQGEDDTYFNCCSADEIRKISRIAKEKGRDFELTVYPGAGHGFNLGPLKNNELDVDSWRKTTDALKRYLR